MGKKKDKKDKKMKGVEKTAIKTEKKLDKKTKKQLQEKGEEDIEAMISEFQEQDRKRQQIVEEKCAAPSHRCNMTLTPHPEKDILMMFGGEYFDGNKTFLYNDLFFYHIKTNDWSQLKAPNAPAPRCSHQAVALHQGGGQLWIFGGEFASPSQSQFYHYRDLWLLHLKDYTWQKINANGGPSSRSGHRMVACRKMLFVFGGFHDNTRDYKYFNDLYAFNVETYKWIKLEIGGIPPSPRSACVMATTQEQNHIVVYGGYSKEHVKRDVDRGQVHTDMFHLIPDSKVKDEGLICKWKWVQVKQTGSRPSARSGCTLVVTSANRALVFGGVFDEEEDEESVKGVFFNEMYSLEVDKCRWHRSYLRKKKESEQKKRRRKNKCPSEGGEKAQSNSEGESSDGAAAEDHLSEMDDDVKRLKVSDPSTADGRADVDSAAALKTVAGNPNAMSTTTYDDGIFTVTVGGPSRCDENAEGDCEMDDVDAFRPCPRMNALMAVKHGVLFVYGGIFEEGDRQVTLSDFYSIDLHKMEEWRTIIPLDLTKQEWHESESSSGDDDDDDESTESDDEGATGGLSKPRDSSKSTGDEVPPADDRMEADCDDEIDGSKNH